MPRLRFPDNDLDRGKRFSKICESGDFEGKTLAQIGKMLGGYGATRIIDWKAGSGIDCRALGAMMSMGVDVFWLLTGIETPNAEHWPKREFAQKQLSPSITDGGAIEAATKRILATPPESCPNAGACQHQAKQLQLLSGIFSLLASPEERAVSAAIDEVQSALLRAIKKKHGAVRESKDEESSPKAAHA